METKTPFIVKLVWSIIGLVVGSVLGLWLGLELIITAINMGF